MTLSAQPIAPRVIHLETAVRGAGRPAINYPCSRAKWPRAASRRKSDARPRLAACDRARSLGIDVVEFEFGSEMTGSSAAAGDGRPPFAPNIVPAHTGHATRWRAGPAGGWCAGRLDAAGGFRDRPNIFSRRKYRPRAHFIAISERCGAADDGGSIRGRIDVVRSACRSSAAENIGRATRCAFLGIGRKRSRSSTSGR